MKLSYVLVAVALAFAAGLAAAQNIRPGLLSYQPRGNPLLGIATPAIYAGGVLSAPTVPGP